MIELYQLVCAINADNRLVLLQSEFRRLKKGVIVEGGRTYEYSQTHDIQLDNPTTINWSSTWSLASAKVHPSADSVKGGELFGALARESEIKTRGLPFSIRNIVLSMPTVRERRRGPNLLKEQRRRGL